MLALGLALVNTAAALFLFGAVALMWLVPDRWIRP